MKKYIKPTTFSILFTVEGHIMLPSLRQGKGDVEQYTRHSNWSTVEDD